MRAGVLAVVIRAVIAYVFPAVPPLSQTVAVVVVLLVEALVIPLATVHATELTVSLPRKREKSMV